MNRIDRRAFLLGVVGSAFALSGWASSPRALREMWIRKVPELGLEIWIENQPPWSGDLMNVDGRPQFVAQSPDYYHPPAVITYASWPEQRVSAAQLEPVADAAIRRGSLNFGLNKHQSRQIRVVPVSHSTLSGFAGSFVGEVQDVPMDVKIIVSQREGRFPIVITVYTMKNKMPLLSEVIRRALEKVRYL